jgi:hypothetical protein
MYAFEHKIDSDINTIEERICLLDIDNDDNNCSYPQNVRHGSLMYLFVDLDRHEEYRSMISLFSIDLH